MFWFLWSSDTSVNFDKCAQLNVGRFCAKINRDSDATQMSILNTMGVFSNIATWINKIRVKEKRGTASRGRAFVTLNSARQDEINNVPETKIKLLIKTSQKRVSAGCSVARLLGCSLAVCLSNKRSVCVVGIFCRFHKKMIKGESRQKFV